MTWKHNKPRIDKALLKKKKKMDASYYKTDGIGIKTDTFMNGIRIVSRNIPKYFRPNDFNRGVQNLHWRENRFHK
jgi:hypothetical protein